MWRSSVRCHFHRKLLRPGIFVCWLISQSKRITRTTTDKHQMMQSGLVLTMSAITRCCLEIKNSNRVAKSFIIFDPQLGIWNELKIIDCDIESLSYTRCNDTNSIYIFSYISLPVYCTKCLIQWNLSITTTQRDTFLPSGAHLGGQGPPRWAPEGRHC